MHLEDGEIKAYLDQALPEAESEWVRDHLGTCSRCQLLAEEIKARAGLVSDRMARLEPGDSEAPMPVAAARARLQESYIDKEKIPMMQRIFSRQYRFAWVAVGAIAVLAIALLFPSVRAVANSFLGLFRVQQITLVTVDPGDLPDRLASSSQFETLFADQTEFEEVGEYQVVEGAGQASQLAGIPVRLPADLGEPNELEVQPGGKMSMKIDLPRIQALLEELGREDIHLPAEIDGAEVSVEIPVAVQASYGFCEYQPGEFDVDETIRMPKDCTTLIQATSPEINAPPGLDVAQLGQAYLQVMGMPADQAAEFSQSVDWSNTLVLPVPRYVGSFEDVQVDGVNAKLIWDQYQPNEPTYMLVWVKDGVVYALSGTGDNAEALEIANSLK